MSFDGDFKFQMVYGEGETDGIADFLSLTATFCHLFDR